MKTEERIKQLEDYSKKLEKRLNEFSYLIECYQKQEIEYLDYIEHLTKRIDSLEIANKNIKSQKEEIEKSKKELSKFYQNKYKNF